jgi:hypothetical protein
VSRRRSSTLISDRVASLFLIDSMPTSSVDADVLRRRARTLRHLADSVTTSEAAGLRVRADADVWIGPTATRCADDLTALGHRLTRAADDLIQRARALERRALALDIVALGTAS